jgi:serine/threonine-protein kinase
VPRAPDLSGTALDGRYELHAVIGEGTFGRVYRGLDRRLARRVAVKVIKPWWAEDPDWVESFEREAQLLASISDPGIVQIFDVGSAPEGLYYVAELVEGESLAQRLRAGSLAGSEALDIAEQLSRALARAHAQNVVHRDVKPANVLLSADGRIKVGDFGVARLAAGSSEAAGATIVGTPRYMAPEQARGGAITPATDVYGVGVVLYEMLAGRPPFDGDSAVELALHHVNDPPPPLPAGVPRAIARVAERALAKTPSERYADGGELADALARARVAAPDVAAAPGGPGRARVDSTRVGQPMSPRRIINPSERRQRIALFGLVVVLALGMVAAAIALAPGHVTVPDLRGMSAGAVRATTHRDGLKASFSSRYSPAPRDTALAQSPPHGRRVKDGSTVRVVLSAGPAPVKVPQLVGSSAGQAQPRLAQVKLRSALRQVPAPGVRAGTVIRQAPAAGVGIPPGSLVTLQVAEVPRLRPLTSFAGQGTGSSVPFRIRGARWQIVSSMSYQGTCTFLFICSGPNATVRRIRDGATVDSFSLDEGTGKTRAFTTGPGVYQISVSPGSDTARWSVKIEDLY